VTYQVAGGAALNVVHCTLKMYPTQAKLEWATLRSAAGYAG
jgi:hypothetical protein